MKGARGEETIRLDFRELLRNSHEKVFPAYNNMRINDIIEKKRDGGALTEEEIKFFIDGYTNAEIPDYQASALLMAMYIRQSTPAETVALTLAMAHSGDMNDLSSLGGITADKHSTGGIGDKTSLVLAPMAASCGLTMAKLSGRGLGFTGGTIDKLESIPGYVTEMSAERFCEIVKKTGICIAAQSGNLAPADKKLYALRDVTATVSNIPLIASSIMSKKLAAGAEVIVLDVKCGKGAFMKTKEEAVELARTMVDIGRDAGRRCAALITAMDEPLGFAVGNSLEVIEAIDTLSGNGPADLIELCVALCTKMLVSAGKGDAATCEKMARESISSGRAKKKLAEMVEAAGGDVSYIYDTSKFKIAKHTAEVLADIDGYVYEIEAERVGRASLMLGAGRATKEDAIDFGAGILLHHKIGDKVKAGEKIATVYSSDVRKLADGASEFARALKISTEIPQKTPLLLDEIN